MVTGPPFGRRGRDASVATTGPPAAAASCWYCPCFTIASRRSSSDTMLYRSNGAGLVTADRHRHVLANTSAHHVPDGRPSQVVEQLLRHAGPPAGCRPCLAKVAD